MNQADLLTISWCLCPLEVPIQVEVASISQSNGEVSSLTEDYLDLLDRIMIDLSGIDESQLGEGRREA